MIYNFTTPYGMNMHNLDEWVDTFQCTFLVELIVMIDHLFNTAHLKQTTFNEVRRF